MEASFPPTLKIGLIQFCPKALDPEANFKTASEYISQAAKEGASLAVLPEYHLTGWYPESSKFAEIASTAHSYVPRYQELAEKLQINIVPGTIVQTPSPSPSAALSSSSASPNSDGSTSTATSESDVKPVLLNIAPFISYTGELLGTYTKVNLWHPERAHLTSPCHPPTPRVDSSSISSSSSPSSPPSLSPSQPHTVIETPLGPVGILVCWDLAFPEAFRSLVKQGAKLIIIPTAWMATDCSAEGRAYNAEAEALFLSSILVARAFENTCVVVFVNLGGRAEDGYLGLSQVAMPLVGPVKGSFSDAAEGLRVVDVDMEILEVAERNYKVREDLARDDWHYGYSLDTKSEPV